VLRKLLTRRAVAGRSYAPYWVGLRKAAQILALLAFLILFLAARWPGSPLQSWAGLFFKLDPLVGLASWLSSVGSGAWLAAGKMLWLGLLTVGLALLAGRAWCGWLCPTGTLLEWLMPRRQRAGGGAGSQPPEKLRVAKYIFLFILLLSAWFGGMAWMIFDPITLLERTLSHSLWPALNWLVTRLEFALYQVWPASGAALAAFDGWARPAVLPEVAIPRSAPFLFAVVFTAIVALNWIAPRFWCRYLCPLGGLLGLLSKAAVLRRATPTRTVTASRRRSSLMNAGNRFAGAGDDSSLASAGDRFAGARDDGHKNCTACKLCSARCPTGTIDPERNFASDPAECTLCLDCLDACPRQAASFRPVFRLAPRLPYDPGRREALASLGAAVISVALFGSSWLRLREHSTRLRPPGVAEDPQLDGGDMPACVRCGACLQACPTSGLQPALSEAGVEGLWTPVLVPRLGYCDYSCNACGQVCPVGAIPALSLEAKRQQTIGKAYVDQDRCLAWADGVPCIVCEEMCPLPQKAITWDEGVSIPGGQPLQRPVVNRELCIGCGICEYKCPLPGPAAIRVQVG
jgi:ferredoxin